MKRSLKLSIYDIAESIKNIESFIKGISEESFSNDKLRQDAIIRRLEIIGEAVKSIPDSFREKHPEIEWKKIAGLRDRIIHAYFEVDPDITWGIIKGDLPELKKKINKIKNNLEK